MTIQILGILFARHHGERMSNLSWSGLSQQWFQRNSGDRAASRPLLTGQEAQVEEVSEEIGESGLENGRRYGSMDASRGSGSRIQPSGLQPEHNEWRDN